MGARERVFTFLMLRDVEIEQCFPGLATGSYTLTSPIDATYNCVAWAVGDTSQFWYDVKVRGYYWPPGVESADTLEGWKRVFAIHGYRESDSGILEDGVEKIAIFVNADSTPSHVARQTETGAWTSKLGKGRDIQHDLLESLEGDEYGKVGIIMQRQCKDGKRVRS